MVGQWIQLSGPADPFTVPDMIVKDSLLLLSADRGTFYSADSGSTWKPVIPEAFYTSILFRDTIYTGGERYSGYGQAALRKMIYSGGSWHAVKVFEKSGPVNDMFADDESIFTAFASDGFNSNVAGFTWSHDGTNWYQANTGLPKDTIYGNPSGVLYVYNLFSVGANGQNVFVGTKKGIYRSPRSSFLWSAKNNGLPEERVNAIFTNDTLTLAAIQNRLFKSTDQGESWTTIHSFATGNRINRIRVFRDTVFALTETQGLYLSANWGGSWFPANNGLTDTRALCLAKMGSSYFLGCGSGVFKGLDPWHNINASLVCSDIRDLEQTGSCMAAAEFSEVYISKDEGQTWERRTPFTGFAVMWSIVNVNNCLFFSYTPGYPLIESRNYISCDNGDTWNLTTPLPDYGDPYVLRSNGSRMVACSDNVIYLSADNGLNWTNIKPPPGMIQASFGDVLFDGDDLYMAAYFNSGVIHSSDFGASWSHCDAGLGQTGGYKLGAALGYIFAFGDSRVFRSANKGLTWTECSAPGQKVQDFTSDNERIFACTETEVWFSRDIGNTWINISEGLPVLPSLWGGTLMARNNFLYYGTNTFGIWKTDIQNLPSSVPGRIKPPEFTLYPNPAGKVIHLSSARNDCVLRIEILDVFGKKVNTGEISGENIDTGLLIPNLYILHVETADHIQHYLKFVKNE